MIKNISISIRSNHHRRRLHKLRNRLDIRSDNRRHVHSDGSTLRPSKKNFRQ